jgi:hypothetical protein
MGLMGASVVIASRRVLSSLPLEQTDKNALESVSTFLRQEANAIRYAETSGKKGKPPARLASSPIAPEVLFMTSTPKNPHQMANRLDEIAQLLDTLASDPKPELAERIYHVFQSLVELSRSASGSSGDQLTGFEEGLER